MQKIKFIFFPSLLIALGILEITFPHALDGFFNFLSDSRGFRGWPGIISFLLVLLLWLFWNKVGGAITLLMGVATAAYFIKTEFFDIKKIDCSPEETQDCVEDKESLLISATKFAIKKSLLERRNKSV